MIDIPKAIAAALESLVDGRAWVLKFPEYVLTTTSPSPWPAIRYTPITHIPDVTVCGDSGLIGSSDYQIDVVARTYGEMRGLLPQVLDSLHGIAVSCVLQSIRETFDDDTKTYRGIMEFRLYQSNVTG